jgi:predicted DNA-binding transcriptional regulator AlpA
MRTLLNVSEVCAELRISPSTLNRWMASGYAPRVTRIGPRVFFARSDVNSWLRLHRE